MRLGALLLAAVAAAGCSMVESEQIPPIGKIMAANALACENNGGYYFLPKTLLKVEVFGHNSDDYKPAVNNLDDPNYNAAASAPKWYLIKVQRRRVPDTRFGYCLDYLRSPTSDDIVKVAKYERSPILGLVASQSVDQSGYILSTLIQTLFVGLSGNPDFAPGTVAARSFWQGPNQPIKVFTAEFDPFDPHESARINESLKDFGFCVLLGGHMFNMHEAKIDSYCDGPRRVFARAPVEKLEYRHSYERVDGIYYRPRVPYNLYLFVKDNMLKSHGRYQVAGGWQLRKTTPVALENISPVVSVGVERTFFAERKTTLVFEEGDLKHACVFKTSELVEFAKIPLQITQSVVALPANVLQVRINNISSEASLVAAENNLIREQVKYLQELSDPVKQVTSYGDLTESTAKKPGETDGLNKNVVIGSDENWVEANSGWAKKLKSAQGDKSDDAFWGKDLGAICDRDPSTPEANSIAAASEPQGVAAPLKPTALVGQ